MSYVKTRTPYCSAVAAIIKPCSGLGCERFKLAMRIVAGKSKPTMPMENADRTKLSIHVRSMVYWVGSRPLTPSMPVSNSVAAVRTDR